MADSKHALSGRLRALTDEIRGNRKLQYGLLAIIAILAVELGLSWSDSLSARERRLQELRTELRQLRGQSRDETALKATLAELESAQAGIEKRLWVVSSDPVGQAKLKDWLTTLAKKTGAQNFKLVLSAPKAATERSAASAAGGTGGTQENAFGLREFRADIGFTFTPEALERVLYAIESGETLASVESLSVVLRSRKAELGVRVVMRLGQPTDAVDAADAVARLGKAAGQSKAGVEHADAAEKPTAGPLDAALPPLPPSSPPLPQPPTLPTQPAQPAPPAKASVPPSVPSPPAAASSAPPVPPVPSTQPPMTPQPAPADVPPPAARPPEASPAPSVPPPPTPGSEPLPTPEAPTGAPPQ